MNCGAEGGTVALNDLQREQLPDFWRTLLLTIAVVTCRPFFGPAEA
jgi:hypothetical protein